MEHLSALHWGVPPQTPRIIILLVKNALRQTQILRLVFPGVRMTILLNYRLLSSYSVLTLKTPS